MVYYFKHNDGTIYKFDPNQATLLMSTRRVAGRDQTRWTELWQTPAGRFVRVDRSLWQGEEDSVRFVDLDVVLVDLALADVDQRTSSGEELLAEHEAEFVQEA